MGGFTCDVMKLVYLVTEVTHFRAKWTFLEGVLDLKMSVFLQCVCLIMYFLPQIDTFVYKEAICILQKSIFTFWFLKCQIHDPQN